MKKFIVGLSVILLSACSLMSADTPTQKVSEFLDKYKKQDTEVLTQLGNIVEDVLDIDDYKDRYKDLMINQYKNLEYKIKDEMVEDDNAVVEVDITVYDYGSAIKNANQYLNDNSDEFMEDEETIEIEDADDETTKESRTNSSYDSKKFWDYKIKQMENVSDRVTYTIEFTLTKVDGKWKIDDLSNSDIEKLHGTYVS